MCLVAECEGIPIGFPTFTKKDEDGDSELTAMYILPSHQQMGYGEKLFKYALSMLEMHSNYSFMWMDAMQLDEPFMKNKASNYLKCLKNISKAILSKPPNMSILIFMSSQRTMLNS